MNTPASCLNCGVCCFSQSPTYIRVLGSDWDRLGAEAEQVAHFVGPRAYMRMADGHCIGLVVTSRDGEPPEFFCSLYERRPRICRELERGSPECQGELTTKAEAVIGEYGR